MLLLIYFVVTALVCTYINDHRTVQIEPYLPMARTR